MSIEDNERLSVLRNIHCSAWLSLSPQAVPYLPTAHDLSLKIPLPLALDKEPNNGC